MRVKCLIYYGHARSHAAGYRYFHEVTATPGNGNSSIWYNNIPIQPFLLIIYLMIHDLDIKYTLPMSYQLNSILQ